MDNRKNRIETKRLSAILMIFCLMLMVLTASPGVWAKEHALGDIPVNPEIYKKFLKAQPMERAAIPLPSEYNAYDDGIVTSAKNQGSCGSCWAFACAGAMESHVQREYGFGLTDLSEEQLLVCSGYGDCNGGNAYALYHWDTDSDGKGPNYEGDFPYDAKDTTLCTEDAYTQIPYRVVDFHSVRTTDDLGNLTVDYFKESLYVDGPSYWRFNVYSDFDTYWSSGDPGDVYTGIPGTSLRGGHAVLLIGWDNDKGALLCKNSWGETGGPNSDGTFWIAYTGHAQSMGFGMYNFGVVMVGCVSEICGDGIDNDCDELVDCNDPDCNSDANCTYCGDGVCNGDETSETCIEDCKCGNDSCDPGEDSCNCAADCGSHPGSETSCSDGVDNDCDGEFDCADTDCYGEITCTCGDGNCLGDENCNTCPGDCISGQSGTCGACFKGVCNGECNPKKEGPDCSDCAPSYCCGNGVCENGENGVNCAVDCGAPPTCGDGTCDPDENSCNCAFDCFQSEADACNDGLDNDCDSYVDCADSECSILPICSSCFQKGSTCTSDDECCSGRCHPKKGVCL